MEAEKACCCEMTEEEKYKQLAQVIDSYGGQESNLIQILHMAQAIFGYIPKEVQQFIAGRMNMPMAKLDGVVSFYSFFSTKPKGRHTISVCLGTACYVRGGKKVLDKIKDTLAIDVAETTPDRRFSLQVMRCIGACGLAPAISIDGEVHKRVNPNKINEILRNYE